MKVLDTRALRHVVSVSVRMALFRLIFGLVKQLLLKGNLLRGPQRILSSVETELVSFNPVKWALFGGTMALYRPVQQLIEQLLDAIVRRGGRSGGSNRDVAPASSTTLQFGGMVDAAEEQTQQQQQQQQQREVRWQRVLSSFLAGALVSLPTLKIFNLTTRTELTLYVVVRALYSLLTEVAAPAFVPAAVRAAVPGAFFNVTALAVISGVLLANSTFQPGTHSAEYRNFLVTATTFKAEQMRVLSELYADTTRLTPPTAAFCAGHSALQDVVRLSAECGSSGTPLPTEVACRVLHPQTRWCWVANLQHMARHLLGVSLPLYGPLKLITTLAKGPARILKDPVGTLVGLVKSTLSSSMFLTLYVCGSYRIVCGLSQFGFRSEVLSGVLCGVVAGLSLLLEPLERQTDLVLFCSMHGLRSGWLRLSQNGAVPRPTRGTIAAAHTLAWALLFAFNEVKPETLRGMFATMIKFFVGRREGEAQSERSPRRIQPAQQAQQVKE